MNVLIVGGGGREHAIAWALSKSEQVEQLYCAPGNGGIAALAQCVPLSATDVDGVVAWAQTHSIDFVVVAPDDPLALGMVDALEDAGIPAFGPRADAAIIEASKIFSKNLMAKYHIPTAKYQTFTELAPALAYIEAEGAPIVVKADGLALGKGVIVAQTVAEAQEAARSMMDGRKFGQAGARVVIEECMTGPEVTVLAFCDGEHLVPMPSSQDHKRAFDGNQGPNTGGMGAYSPAPVVTPEIYQMVMDQIIYPTVRGMKEDGIVFTGFLYAGLMISKDASGKPTVKTLEFNCRFGDPETQPIMSRLKSDFSELIEAGIDGSLDKVIAEWDPRCALGVVLASKGYPTAPRKGDVISGTELQGDDTITFHAGTKFNDKGELVTSGGRVLCVVGLGGDLHQARDKAYKALDKVHFDGMQYRKDIGHRAL